MSWLSDTRDEIKFISPEGNTFLAYWKNNDRSFEKKLGQFDPPGFKGTIIQDLASKSWQYPLTVFFEGIDHNKRAEKFAKSLYEEKGSWEITHPTKGVLNLQLINCKEIINPITDGNISTFETSWLEPAVIDLTISAQELTTSVLLQIINVIEDSITTLKQLRSDLYSAIQSAINVMTKISGFTKIFLSEMAATDKIVNQEWQAAQNSFLNILTLFQNNATDEEIQTELVNLLIDIISIPLEANSDYSSRNSIYVEILDEFLTLAPEGASAEDYNKIIFLEMGIVGILISICRIIVTSTFKTRSEIISAIDNLTNIFNDAINALETVQDNFIFNNIDGQYFSESKNYTALQNTFALTMRYLLTQFFNLKIERRFFLKKARSPIEITITEYGDIDSYDLFLSSNNLSGNNILLLQSGHEVVIYD